MFLNNELKFYIGNIDNASGAMNRRLPYPGLTITASPDGELLMECPGIIKRCTQGLARTRIALCQRPGADTEETGRHISSVERFVVF